METDNHRLIAALSAKYTDGICEAKADNTTFTRESIAAAYIVGAEETLQRICNVIRESAKCGGLTQVQSKALIGLIEHIESLLQR